ncbi:hypothetical protein BXO87_02270 [Bacillus sp. GZB]|nr:hypothetical protein BXO87_02270 [Bacillus sp. GZB]
MNDIFDDFFDRRIKEYIAILNRKFANKSISADRYRFLFAKLLSWTDVYDASEENRNNTSLYSDY